MAGDARSNQFNIGVSTVMIGPMDKVEELTPEEHSIGLIKNFSLTSETSQVELTQGIRNKRVDSQVTGVTTTMSFEVYEYTAENLAYAALLDGANYVTGGTYTLAEAVTGGDSATSVVISAEEDISAKFPAGSKIQLQASGAKKFDKVFLATVSGASFETNKLTLTLKSAIPTGWSFSVGDKVFGANVIPVGSEEPQPYLGVKIVGILPNGNEPVTIIVPKAKVSAGMTLGFTTDNYGNLPFEITPYDLTPSDALYEKYADQLANAYIVTR